jgi:hypothetical protein
MFKCSVRTILFILNNRQRQIILILILRLEFVHVLTDTPRNLVSRQSRVPPRRVGQPLNSELLAPGIFGFRHSVRVEHKQVARLQLHVRFFVLDAGEALPRSDPRAESANGAARLCAESSGGLCPAFAIGQARGVRDSALRRTPSRNCRADWFRPETR